MQFPSRTAIVLVDHGSRSEAANASLEEVARQVAGLAGGNCVAVLPAHMEIARPTVADAFDEAVRVGADFVVVVSYFLAPGRHSAVDIPAQAAEAASRHGGLRYVVTESLGPDPGLSALVVERVGEAVSAAARAARS